MSEAHVHSRSCQRRPNVASKTSSINIASDVKERDETRRKVDVRIEEIYKKRIDRIHNFKADITGSNGHFLINEQRLQPYFWVVNCTSCVFPPNNHISCFSFLLLISSVSHVSILSFYNSFSRS